MLRYNYLSLEDNRMSNKTKEFLDQCAKNKEITQQAQYSDPSITALDLEDIVDLRGGSNTTVTTTGAAVACAVSAIF